MLIARWLSKHSLRILVAAVLLGGLLIEVTMFDRLADGIEYFVRERSVSPDQSLEITRFVSGLETGHAPEGQYLVLTEARGITHPEDGHILLAGYCDRPFRYGWRDDGGIWWYCPFGKSEIETYSPMAFGHEMRQLSPTERGLFRFP